MRFLKISTILVSYCVLTVSVGIVRAQDPNLAPKNESQDSFKSESLTETPQNAPQSDSLDSNIAEIVPSEKSESESEIDKLFAKLVNAPNKASAESVANQISKLWFESGSDTVTLLMTRAGKAMNRKDYYMALDFLDAVIRLKPKYAEGWNRRATVLYLVEDYELSIKDIEKTLALEPRHWGALSGLASIMRILDRPEDALKIYKRILEIYPFLESAKLSMDDVELELRGKKL